MPGYVREEVEAVEIRRRVQRAHVDALGCLPASMPAAADAVVAGADPERRGMAEKSGMFIGHLQEVEELGQRGADVDADVRRPARCRPGACRRCTRRGEPAAPRRSGDGGGVVGVGRVAGAQAGDGGARRAERVGDRGGVVGGRSDDGRHAADLEQVAGERQAGGERRRRRRWWPGRSSAALAPPATDASTRRRRASNRSADQRLGRPVPLVAAAGGTARRCWGTRSARSAAPGGCRRRAGGRHGWPASCSATSPSAAGRDATRRRPRSPGTTARPLRPARR